MRMRAPDRRGEAVRHDSGRNFSALSVDVEGNRCRTSSRARSPSASEGCRLDRPAARRRTAVESFLDTPAQGARAELVAALVPVRAVAIARDLAGVLGL